MMYTEEPIQSDYTAQSNDTHAFSKHPVHTKRSRLRPIQLFALLFLLLMVPVSILAVQRVQFLSSRASSESIEFSFLTADNTVGGDKNITLALDAKSHSIGFVQAQIIFDPHVLQLRSEIQPLSNLRRVISQTSMSSANSTGIIRLIYAIKPEDLNQAPSHLFQIASLAFDVPAQIQPTDHTTKIWVDIPNSQVVDMHAAPLNPTAIPVILVFNPRQTPPPTGSKLPTPSAIVFPTSTPILHPTPNPTGSPFPVSGEIMPKGDIPGWHQVFSDDFLTDVSVGNFPNAVSSTWGAYPNTWHDTTKKGSYDPGKVISIQNGLMNIHLHTENGTHLVSAPYPKIPGAVGKEGGLLYGRYAIRFRADSLSGYKTAWLLWPDSETWPRDGEIDFPEGDLNGSISAFMHRMNGANGSDQDAYQTNTTYGDWHTAVTEWLPNSLKFYLDGKLIGNSTSRVPSTPMHWVIQTETSTDTNTPPDNSTAGNVQIDWVSVYTPIQ